MRTGLKTLFRKTKRLIKHPDLLFNEEPSSFPEKGIPEWKLDLKLYSLANELSGWKMEEKIGSFHCTPHPVAIKTWQKLLKFNPNNLGNWSLSNQKELDGTRRIERNLIRMMIDLYGGKNGEWEGYVTSGATESNIFSVWVGRKFLEKSIPKQRICILVNSLTHYSIVKAADVAGIEVLSTPLDRKTWSTDIDSLLATIRKLKKEYKGFLIPLTLGYTQTGTNDDYENIIKKLKDLEKKLNISVFVFLDVALSGLVLPFTKKNFKPLKNPRVQTFCVDFHKAGMSPIGCGIIIYRKELRKYIERKIPYISENDNTVLGTRAGISPVAAYSVLLSLGRNGFGVLLRRCMKEKEKFKKIVKSNFPKVEITEDIAGISVGLVSQIPLPNYFLSKYGLFAKKQSLKFRGGVEKFYIYKASFLYREKIW